MQFILIFLTAGGQELKEFPVIIVAEFIFRPCPKGFNQINSLPIDGNREVNKITILLHYLLHLSFLQKLFVFILDVHNHTSASN